MDSITSELESALSSDRVVTDMSAVARESDNTLGVKRAVQGVLYPRTAEEVMRLVQIANARGLALYPVSRGRNIGYGQKTPTGENQWIVDLRLMNRIRDFDPVHGYVTMEPGVTQEQLYKYLARIKARFWMDPTGAGLQASIVGNTLEGGFGHTPMGNHRRSIRQAEVVLGNGTFMMTGEFPGLGPDLSGIFVQSNFGIITALKIELMPKSSHFESFLIQIDEDRKLGPFIHALRNLRQQGTVTSIVHIANAIRALMTARDVPPGFKDKVIGDKDALRLMSSPLFKSSPWTATGGLYGSRDEVEAKKRTTKSSLHGIAKVRFFTDQGLDMLDGLLNNGLMRIFPWTRDIGASISRYKPLHGLLKGIPSDEPFRHIHWKIKNPDDLGLLWLGPTIPASSKSVWDLINTAKAVYKKYGYECALTMSFVEPAQLVGILSITFNKNRKSELAKAHKAYAELMRGFEKKGIKVYRTGLLSMPHVKYPDGKQDTLEQLKQTLDPNSVISPGRYLNI